MNDPSNQEFFDVDFHNLVLSHFKGLAIADRDLTAVAHIDPETDVATILFEERRPLDGEENASLIAEKGEDLSKVFFVDRLTKITLLDLKEVARYPLS